MVVRYSAKSQFCRGCNETRPVFFHFDFFAFLYQLLLGASSAACEDSSYPGRAFARCENRQDAGNQVILIQGDKIVSVSSDTQAPAGAQMQVIDLPNATVLPGLIDAHTHLTMTTNFGYSRLAISIPREALNGARNARVTLDAGFTTVRNVGASGFTDVALRDAINAGDVPGPRMLVSGPALSITGGHCDNNLLPFE